MVTEQEETRNRSTPLVGELEKRSNRIDWMKRSRGDANYRLNEIVIGLKDVQEQLWTFIDQGHGDGCDCSFCSTPWSENQRGTTDGEIVEHDVRGVLWAIEVAVSTLGSEITRLDPEELDELRDQRERQENLKVLADTMAEIQQAADDDSETPHVVSARITVEV